MNFWKKRGRKAIAIIGVLAFWACSTAAAGQNKQGFSGYLQPLVGVASVKSVSSVGDDNARINSLDQEGRSETVFIPMIDWNLGYGLAEGSVRLWAGSSDLAAGQGSGGIEVGTSFSIGDGSRIVLAYSPPIMDREVWEDPFLVGRNRAETDMASQGIHMGVESLMGLPLNLSYQFSMEDVDQDRAGASVAVLSAGDRAALKRSGKRHQADISWDMDLGHGLALQPAVGFTRGEADGQAYCFDRWAGALGMVYTQGRASFSVQAGIEASEYDSSHPVFNRTREDKGYSLALGLTYHAPFGFDSAALVLYSAAIRQNSNIVFYDERILMTGIGVNWAF